MEYIDLVEDSLRAYSRHPVLPILFSFLIVFTAANAVFATGVTMAMVATLEAVLLVLAAGIVFEMSPVMERGGVAGVRQHWEQFGPKEGRVLLGAAAKYLCTALPLVLIAFFAASAALLGVAAVVFGASMTGVQTLLSIGIGVAGVLSVLVYIGVSFTVPEIVIRDRSVAAAVTGSLQFVRRNVFAVLKFYVLLGVIAVAAVVFFGVAAGAAAAIDARSIPVLAAVILTFLLPFLTVLKALFYIRMRR